MPRAAYALRLVTPSRVRRRTHVNGASTTNAANFHPGSRHVRCSASTMNDAAPKSTLLDLLMKLQHEEGLRSERALVRRVVKLVRSGRVVLSGTFRGVRTLK